jgi:YggT family protein
MDSMPINVLLYDIAYRCLSFVIAAIIFNAILSWVLVVVRNDFVYKVYHVTRLLLSPLYNPIEKIIPSFGGISFTAVVALLLIQALMNVLPVIFSIGMS